MMCAANRVWLKRKASRLVMSARRPHASGTRRNQARGFSAPSSSTTAMVLLDAPSGGAMEEDVTVRRDYPASNGWTAHSGRDGSMGSTDVRWTPLNKQGVSMKWIIALCATAALSGCIVQREWVKPGVTVAERDADTEACWQQGKDATAKTHELFAGMIIAELGSQCYGATWIPARSYHQVIAPPRVRYDRST